MKTQQNKKLSKKAKIAAATIIAATLVVSGLSVWYIQSEKSSAMDDYQNAYLDLSAEIADAQSVINEIPNLSYMDNFDKSDDNSKAVSDLSKKLDSCKAPADSTIKVSSFKDVDKANKQTDAMLNCSNDIKSLRTYLQKKIDDYRMSTANKVLSDKVSKQSEDIKSTVANAKSVLKGAKSDDGYKKGFSNSDQGKKLIKELEDAISAKATLDTNIDIKSIDGITSAEEKVANNQNNIDDIKNKTKALNDAVTKWVTDHTPAATSNANSSAASQRGYSNSSGYSSSNRSYSSGSNYSGSGTGRTTQYGHEYSNGISLTDTSSDADLVAQNQAANQEARNRYNNGDSNCYIVYVNGAPGYYQCR